MKSNILKQIKVCPVCNRPFENRKKWKLRGIWEHIIYCSNRCRKENKRKPLR
ncbi:MAG: hypothetical protein CMI23_08255 [Opitutae bacterium]|nr:hypothetical protein [Opitutae bacterium]